MPEPVSLVAMARYAIDAATLLRIVRDGPQVNGKHQLVAPNLIRSEVMSMLLAMVNGGEITEDEALQIHERMTELKIRLLGDRVSRRTAWKIARQRGWESTYRAEYLAVATLQADALVATDPEIAAAAKDLVPLAPYDALAAD